MLKECYYENTKNFTSLDYNYLYRFIDRMIQYRYSFKGSYNGKRRIEEIKNIDLNKLDHNTKNILYYCIKRHNADELINLDNLKSLNDYNLNDTIILINKLKSGDYMKLKLNDFYNNLKELNIKIKELINNKELPEDYILNIKCIGGFAMSYLGIRGQGLTEDMDSLCEIDYLVKQAIREIAKKNSLPIDWVNNVMKIFYSEDQFHWSEVSWFFGKDSKIKVFVCSKEDLLKLKIKMAESYLNHMNFQDRDPEIDYNDTLDLLNSFNIGLGTSVSMTRIKLFNLGIKIEDYPEMFKKIIENTEPENSEDTLILEEINKVEKNIQDMSYFKKFIFDNFEYSLNDIINYYSLYLNEFPKFKAQVYNELKL